MALSRVCRLTLKNGLCDGVVHRTKRCLCGSTCFFFLSFLLSSRDIPSHSRSFCDPLHRRRFEAKARIHTRGRGRRRESRDESDIGIARILERQRDERRGDMSRRGSRTRSREGRETARQRAREIEKKSRFLGTWRTSAGSTKRFRSFDIPNSSRSCSFCRPSALSPSAALKRRVFARGWDAQRTMLPTRVGAYWRLKKETFAAILRAGCMSRCWKNPTLKNPTA